MYLLLLIIWAALFSPGHLEAQTYRSQTITGVVLEDIESAFNRTQRYALYVPSSYRSDRTWPIVFLMDPRGRATVPVDRFKDVAEERGYILISSYNTASDTVEDVNTPALRAMFHDANQRFSIDQRRFYLSGFSGTARYAWFTAAQLEDNIAGIIGFGGGLPPDFQPLKNAPYGYYGAAGVTDFNFEEMRDLDASLDERGIANRFEFFPGGHEWGPADVCTRGVEWMELRAMKTGLREKDQELVTEIYQRRLQEADGSESLYESYLRYRAAAEDFEGLLDSGELSRLSSKVKELEDLDEVGDALEQQKKLSGQYRSHMSRFARILHDLETGENDLALPQMVRALNLYSLKKQSQDQKNPMKAQAAGRLLESMYVQLAYYLPRDYLNQNEPNRAITLLQIADVIKPDTAQHGLFLARAYAQKGDAKKAVELLERVNEVFPLDPDRLASDRYFDPIRDKKEFLELLGRLRDS
jgi:predicted esterase